MPALGSPTSCYFSIFFIETKCIISLVCLCIFQPMMAIPVNDSLAFALLSKDSLDVAPKNWDSVRPEKLQWFFKFRSTNATTKIPPYFFAPKLVFFASHSLWCYAQRHKACTALRHANTNQWTAALRCQKRAPRVAAALAAGPVRHVFTVRGKDFVYICRDIIY